MGDDIWQKLRFPVVDWLRRIIDNERKQLRLPIIGRPRRIVDPVQAVVGQGIAGAECLSGRCFVRTVGLVGASGIVRLIGRLRRGRNAGRRLTVWPASRSVVTIICRFTASVSAGGRCRSTAS